MKTVGAYIELQPGEEPPGLGTGLELEAMFVSRSAEGLTVERGWPDPPEDAQVYLFWEPRVVVKWEEETEIEDGDGDETESAGPSTPEEVDEEPGQPGDLVEEETGPEPEEVDGAEEGQVLV